MVRSRAALGPGRIRPRARPTPDEAYERGKSGYKLLQYAASGLPVLASPVGVNAEIQAKLGMPAPREPGEWAEAIVVELARTAGERAELGRRARDVVEREYSFDAWLGRWRAAVGLPQSVPG